MRAVIDERAGGAGGVVEQRLGPARALVVDVHGVGAGFERAVALMGVEGVEEVERHDG